MISSHLIVNISTGCLSDCWLRTSILCGLPKRHCGKESACQCRRCKRREFHFSVGKILWRRKWQRARVFLPETFHGQMRLEGYGPWGCKESNMTVHACTYSLWDFFMTNLQHGKSLILEQLKGIKRGSQGMGNHGYVTLITFF